MTVFICNFIITKNKSFVNLPKYQNFVLFFVDFDKIISLDYNSKIWYTKLNEFVGGAIYVIA